jgi:hypothetical protein
LGAIVMTLFEMRLPSSVRDALCWCQGLRLTNWTSPRRRSNLS